LTLYQPRYIPAAKSFYCPRLKNLYGSYGSYANVPTYGNFYDMNYVNADTGGRYLNSSYAFVPYDMAALYQGSAQPGTTRGYRLTAADTILRRD